jgi:hypothetical protein
MTPRDVARLIAAVRIGAGVTLLAAPGTVTRPWIGAHAGLAGTRVMVRGLGIRDAIMGGIQLHTVDHPQVGPRWVATGALADAVDGLATLAARRDLPRVGGPLLGVGALAVAAAGLLAARALREQAEGETAGAAAPVAAPAAPVNGAQVPAAPQGAA